MTRKKKTYSLKKRQIIVPYMLQTFAWPIARLFFLVYYSMEIRGREHLRELRAPAIFAANHVSEFDPILVTGILPFMSRFFPMFYVSAPYIEFKDKVFKWRRFIYRGFFFRSWGAYPANRGIKNYSLSLKYHLSLLANRNSITIFPSGKRIHPDDKRNHGFGGGVMFLAQQANVPIVPIFISFSPTKRRRFWNNNKRIIISIKKPVMHSDFLLKDNPSHETYVQAVKKFMHTHCSSL